MARQALTNAVAKNTITLTGKVTRPTLGATILTVVVRTGQVK